MTIMPKITRSLKEVDAVRDQIIDIAFKILIKSGYEGLKMGKIASKMRMTAANLYNYYTNKDELLIAIHKKAHIMLYDKLRYAVETADTPLEKFKKMAYAFVEFGTQNINIYDIMFNRPVRQHRDYIGTPLEALSYDEFISSQRILSLAVKTTQDYRETRQDLQPVDPRSLTNQCTITLHGIISLHNSGAFIHVIDDSEMAMNTYINKAISSVIG